MISTEGELQIVHLNIRSLRKNFHQLLVLLKDCAYSIDIIILSEINIKQDELSMYNIQGYEMHANTRKRRRGGGILFYTKSMHNANLL